MELSCRNRSCCGTGMPNCASGSGQSQMSKRKEPMNCSMSRSANFNDRVPAMAYVPMQQFEQVYDLKTALKLGTLFPELCKPFCGKGGGMCL